MKEKNSLCIILTVVMFLTIVFPALMSTVSAPEIETNGGDSAITIDGKFEDWAAVDTQLFTDYLGDTQPWSINTTFMGPGLPFPWNAPLYYGNTSETVAEIPINDRARDLYKFYAYMNDPGYLYFRLDVDRLSSENWMWGPNCDNASVYVIAFDTTRDRRGRSDDYGHACDTKPPTNAPWEYELVWGDSPKATRLQGPTRMYLQGNDWLIYDDNNSTAGGRLSFTQNLSAYTDEYGAHSSFEIKMPHSDLSIMPGATDDWDGWALFVTVFTFKPGENYVGWTLAFDPQLPGDTSSSAPPIDPRAWGSDVADVIPGGDVNGLDVGRDVGMGQIMNFIVICTEIKAGFTYSPVDPWPNETVNFDASASSPSRYIIKYEWDFGDGAKDHTGMVHGVPPSSIITHRYTTTGSYNVTLKVTCTEIFPNTSTTWQLVNVTVQTAEPLNDTAVLWVAPMGIPRMDFAYVKLHPTWKYGFYIEVFVKNLGTVTASNVLVSLYNGTPPTLIGKQTITLGPHADANLKFPWTPLQNLTYLTRIKGYPWPYPTRTDIKANITVVEGDVNVTNNELLWGNLTIRYPGDPGKIVFSGGQWIYIPSDGKVYIEDLGLFGKWGWGSDRTKPCKTKVKYEAFGFYCDFNHDEKVWVEDLALLGRNWGAKPIGSGIY